LHGTVEFSIGAVTMTNCLMAFNKHACAVFNGDSSEAYLTCCDIYGNEGGDYVNVIMGQQFSDGNFSEDPVFCGPQYGNVFPAAGSPCLPANNTCVVQIGAYGQGCETGFVCGDIDGDGQITILDLVNMLECIYQSIGCPPDPLEVMDYNQDDGVNVLDVIYLISYLYFDGPPPVCW
jgi:hypothetical protein